ncbi:MAG: Gfo/Idh/MocA family oxidoreductase [Rhodospirillales bacterium]
MSMRIAVAGSGFFSRFHFEAWSRLDVEVAGICSLDQGSAEEIAQRFPGCRVFDDFARMLDATKPELVDIVTPPPTHPGFIEAALGRGIATICQKPFCGGLEDARKAAAWAAETGVPLIVHENFRFQPWYTEIKNIIDAGMLGTVYQGTFRLRPGDGQGADAYLDRQPYFQQMPRLLVHETLVHLIDVFRALFGEAEWVMADLRKLNPVIAGEDAGIVVLGFKGGRRAVIDGNRLVDHAAQNRRLVMGEMLVEGADRCLRLDGDAGLFQRRHGSNDETPVAYDWHDNGYGGDCVYRLNRHVLEALAAGETPLNSASAYLANLAIVDAVYRSDAEGRRIEL